ncbi:MAG: hypothetical protein R3A44_34640 [Caldilineaceae bacterium]
MRTIEQIRNHLIENLGYAIRRPGMWIFPPHAIELFLQHILSDICFIDERENDLKVALHALNKQKKATNRGVFGAFHEGFNDQEIDISRLYHEVTSIYAELAWQMGYLTVERQLSKKEWNSLRAGLRSKYTPHDTYESQISAQYGEPSLKIGAVHCYTCEAENEGWIFFDFWTEHITEQTQNGVIVNTKYRDDPILRNIRLPASTFKRGLVFTPYGQQFAAKKKHG